MKVRPARDGDILAISKIEKRLFREHGYVPSQVRYYMRREGARFLVVVDDDGRVIGHAAGAPTRYAGTLDFWLNTLAVIPAEREQGLGMRLMRALLRHAKKLGARAAKLQVARRNRAAIRLYEQLGFTQGRILYDYYAKGRDAVLMTKVLT